MKKIHITSLGCPKNLVDTEVLIGHLERSGWQICEEQQTSDVMLVNTCGFIQPAVEEGIETILELAQEKTTNQRLVVTGCMVQRYRELLRDEIPEIDLLIGTEGITDISRLLEGLLSGGNAVSLHIPGPFLMNSATPRRIVTPFYRAWMKITEGCNNHCSYCMIPSIRGDLRSRSIDDLVEEAKGLEAAGVKELLLIGQDLTAYGTEHGGVSQLETLVRHMLSQTSIPWLRLLYLYPSRLSDELLAMMAENDRIVPYLDIPFQHVSDRVLLSMNRNYGYAELVALVEKTRKYVPDIALRTTFLLGFPGETEEDVELVAEIVRHLRLDHVGAFAYSNEQGVPSETFPGQVDEEEKQRRVDYIMSLQAEISGEIQRKYVGKTLPVLVEGVSSETDLLLEGRTRYQAPEIDGCVYINDGTANIGDIVNVEISDSQIYDLVGAIVSG